MACGLFFLCKLRKGSILISCLVALMVTPATSGHSVYSPDVLRSFSSPISYATAMSSEAPVPAYWLPIFLETPNALGQEHSCIWWKQAKFPVEIQFKSFMKFYKRQMQKLCKKACAVSNAFCKNLLFQRKRQSILFKLAAVCLPVFPSQLQPCLFILVTMCMG